MGYDVLKQYSIKINADLKEATSELDQFGARLDELEKRSGTNNAIRAEFDSIKKSLDGLKGAIGKQTSDIAAQLDKIDATNLENQFKEMQKLVSDAVGESMGSIKEFTASVEALQKNDALKGFATNLADSFNKVSASIAKVNDDMLSSFGKIQEFMAAYKETAIPTKELEKQLDNAAEIEQAFIRLQKLANDFTKKNKGDFWGFARATDHNVNSKKQALELLDTVNEIKEAYESLMKLDKKHTLGNKPNALLNQMGFAVTPGVQTQDRIKAMQEGIDEYKYALEDVYDVIADVQNKAEAKLAKQQEKKPPKEHAVRFKYVIDENEAQTSVNSIVNKIRTSVVDNVNKALDQSPIVIPIKYVDQMSVKPDKSNSANLPKNDDQITEEITRNIMVRLDADRSQFISSINESIKSINDYYASADAPKLKIPIITGNLEVAQNAQVTAIKTEDERKHEAFMKANRLLAQADNTTNTNTTTPAIKSVISGGTVDIGDIGGLATENTLSAIHGLLADIHTTVTGIVPKESEPDQSQEPNNLFKDYWMKLGKSPELGDKVAGELRALEKAGILIARNSGEAKDMKQAVALLKKNDEEGFRNLPMYKESVAGMARYAWGNETIEHWQETLDAQWESARDILERGFAKIDEIDANDPKQWKEIVQSQIDKRQETLTRDSAIEKALKTPEGLIKVAEQRGQTQNRINALEEEMAMLERTIPQLTTAGIDPTSKTKAQLSGFRYIDNLVTSHTKNGNFQWDFAETMLSNVSSQIAEKQTQLSKLKQGTSDYNKLQAEINDLLKNEAHLTTLVSEVQEYRADFQRVIEFQGKKKELADLRQTITSDENMYQRAIGLETASKTQELQEAQAMTSWMKADFDNYIKARKLEVEKEATEWFRNEQRKSEARVKSSQDTIRQNTDVSQRLEGGADYIKAYTEANQNGTALSVDEYDKAFAAEFNKNRAETAALYNANEQKLAIYQEQQELIHSILDQFKENPGVIDRDKVNQLMSSLPVFEEDMSVFQDIPQLGKKVYERIHALEAEEQTALEEFKRIRTLKDSKDEDIQAASEAYEKAHSAIVSYQAETQNQIKEVVGHDDDRLIQFLEKHLQVLESGDQDSRNYKLQKQGVIDLLTQNRKTILGRGHARVQEIIDTYGVSAGSMTEAAYNHRQKEIERIEKDMQVFNRLVTYSDNGSKIDTSLLAQLEKQRFFGDLKKLNELKGLQIAYREAHANDEEFLQKHVIIPKESTGKHYINNVEVSGEALEVYKNIPLMLNNYIKDNNLVRRHVVSDEYGTELDIQQYNLPASVKNLTSKEISKLIETIENTVVKELQAEATRRGNADKDEIQKAAKVSAERLFKDHVQLYDTTIADAQEFLQKLRVEGADEKTIQAQQSRVNQYTREKANLFATDEDVAQIKTELDAARAERDAQEQVFVKGFAENWGFNDKDLDLIKRLVEHTQEADVARKTLREARQHLSTIREEYEAQLKADGSTTSTTRAKGKSADDKAYKDAMATVTKAETRLAALSNRNRILADDSAFSSPEAKTAYQNLLRVILANRDIDALDSAYERYKTGGKPLKGKYENWGEYDFQQAFANLRSQIRQDFHLDLDLQHSGSRIPFATAFEDVVKDDLENAIDKVSSKEVEYAKARMQAYGLTSQQYDIVVELEKAADAVANWTKGQGQAELNRRQEHLSAKQIEASQNGLTIDKDGLVELKTRPEREKEKYEQRFMAEYQQAAELLKSVVSDLEALKEAQAAQLQNEKWRSEVDMKTASKVVQPHSAVTKTTSASTNTAPKVTSSKDGTKETHEETQAEKDAKAIEARLEEEKQAGKLEKSITQAASAFADNAEAEFWDKVEQFLNNNPTPSSLKHLIDQFVPDNGLVSVKDAEKHPEAKYTYSQFQNLLQNDDADANEYLRELAVQYRNRIFDEKVIEERKAAIVQPYDQQIEAQTKIQDEQTALLQQIEAEEKALVDSHSAVVQQHEETLKTEKTKLQQLQATNQKRLAKATPEALAKADKATNEEYQTAKKARDTALANLQNLKLRRDKHTYTKGKWQNKIEAGKWERKIEAATKAWEEAQQKFYEVNKRVYDNAYSKADAKVRLVSTSKQEASVARAQEALDKAEAEYTTKKNEVETRKAKVQTDLNNAKKEIDRLKRDRYFASSQVTTYAESHKQLKESNRQRKAELQSQYTSLKAERDAFVGRKDYDTESYKEAFEHLTNSINEWNKSIEDGARSTRMTVKDFKRKFRIGALRLVKAGEFDIANMDQAEVEQRTPKADAQFAREYRTENKIVPSTRDLIPFEKSWAAKWRTAGMTKEQAEITHQIAKLNSQYKKTAEDKAELARLQLIAQRDHQLTINKKGYVKELMTYKEFKADPKKYGMSNDAIELANKYDTQSALRKLASKQRKEARQAEKAAYLAEHPTESKAKGTPSAKLSGKGDGTKISGTVFVQRIIESNGLALESTLSKIYNLLANNGIKLHNASPLLKGNAVSEDGAEGQVVTPKRGYRSHQAIKNLDWSKMSLKQLESYQAKANKAIEEGASTAPEWSKALIEIDRLITQIQLKEQALDAEGKKLSKNSGKAIEFVKQKLKEAKLDLGKFNIENAVDTKGLSRFVVNGEKGRANIGIKDGKWAVSYNQLLQTDKTQFDAMGKEFARMQRDYNVKQLVKANPMAYYKAGGDFEQQVAHAQTVYGHLTDVFNHGLQDKSTLETLRSELDLVTQISDVLKENASLAPQQVGSIDFTKSDSVKKQLLDIMSSAEDNVISIGKLTKNSTELSYAVKTADNTVEHCTLTIDRNTGAVTKSVHATTEYINGFSRLAKGFGAKFHELFRYFAASASIYRIISMLKQGVNVVIEMDKAMTNLKKVSNDTEASLNRFRKTAYEIGESIGSTGKAIVDSATAWARLGYSIEEASVLAKNSVLYANVGDMDATTATEHLISSLKAFNVEAKNSIDIVDKFNEIGNNYAISSQEIGSALERSAAALVAAGNDINQSIALITAGNTIQQDADAVGNAMKVVSLRIRGSKSELESFGEETDSLIFSTSKLRNELKALTGVDIMLNDSTYKSTYDIMVELSNVWKKLDDVTQANVLEKLAGKTRSSVVAGLLQQGETLQKVYQDSQDAEGSALRENDRYMKSIEGHVNKLKNAWNEAWDDELSGNLIKGVVDFGTAIVKVADSFGLLNTAIVAFAGVKGITSFFKNKDVIGLWTQNIQNAAKAFKGIGSSAAGIEQAGAACRGLSQIQRDLAMDMAGLSKIQKDLILIQASGVDVTEKLSLAQLGEMLSNEGVSASEEVKIAATVADKIGTDNLTLATILQSAELDDNTKKTIANALAKKALTESNEKGAKSSGRLAQALSRITSATGLSSTAILGIGAGIAAVIAGIAIGVKKYNQHLKEIADNAVEAGDKLKSIGKSIDEQISKIKDLRNQLKDTSLSESQVYETKKQIYAIQNDIVGQYDLQNQQLDLVNGKLSDQLGIIQSITKANAAEYLASGNNQEAYERAYERLNQRRGIVFAGTDYEQLQAWQEQIKEFGVAPELFSTVYANSSAPGMGGSLRISGTSQEQYDALVQLKTKLDQDSKTHSYRADANKKLSDIIGYIIDKDFDTEQMSQDKSIVETYNQSIVLRDYSDLYQDAKESVEDFNHALMQGNKQAIEAAKTTVETFYQTWCDKMAEMEPGVQSIFEQIFGGANWSQYYSRQFDQILGSEEGQDWIQRLLGYDDDPADIEQKLKTKNRAITEYVAGFFNRYRIPPDQFDLFKERLIVALTSEPPKNEPIKLDKWLQGSIGNDTVSSIISDWSSDISAVGEALHKLNDGESYQSAGAILQDVPGLEQYTKKYAKDAKGLSLALTEYLGVAYDELIKKLDNPENIEGLDELKAHWQDLIYEAQGGANNLTTLKDSYKELTGYLEKIRKGDSLSTDEMSYLINKYDALQDSVLVLSDGYSIEEQALIDLCNQYIEYQNTSVAANIVTTKKTLESVRSQIEAYTSLSKTFRSLGQLLSLYHSAGIGAMRGMGIDQGLIDLVAFYDTLHEQLEGYYQEIDDLMKEREEEGTTEFDWIETKIDRVSSKLEKFRTTIENTFSTWSKRIGGYSDVEAALMEDWQTKQKAYETYSAKAKSFKLDSSLKALVQNGAYDITKYSDKTAEQIEKYRDLYDKSVEAELAAIDAKEALQAFGQTKFDNVVSQFDSILSVFENKRSMIDSLVSLVENTGHIVGKKFYQAMLKVQNAEIAAKQAERDGLAQKLQQAVDKNKIEVGSEAWANMAAQIDECDTELLNMNNNVLELNKNIRQVSWDVFDKVREQISGMNDEAEFLVDLMSHKKLFDTKDNHEDPGTGLMTQYGKATLGLYAQEYYTYKHEAKAYAGELEDIEEQLAKDRGNMDLLERRNALLSSQRESILAAEQEKEAIKDLVAEGIDAQVNSLQHLIDKYEEALDAEKDLYDYQRDISKQTKTIADLRKQIAAYAGDVSEEAKAKVQSLKIELNDTEEEVANSQYEHYISEQKQFLTKLAEKYEDTLKLQLEDIDQLLKKTIGIINSDTTTIKSTIDKVTDKVGYEASNFINRVWSGEELNKKAVNNALSADENIKGIKTSSKTIDSNISSMLTDIQDAFGKDGTLKGIYNVLKEWLQPDGGAINGINSIINAVNGISIPSATPAELPKADAPKADAAKANDTPKETKNNDSKTETKKAKNKKTTTSAKRPGDDFFVLKTYAPSTKWNLESVEDRLKSQGIAGEFEYRKIYYEKMGLGSSKSYVGSAAQNLAMLAWLKKNGYKTGVHNLKRDELNWTNEGGAEAIIRPSDGAILTPLKSGDSVLTTKATENLWKMANDPFKFVKENMSFKMGGSAVNNTTTLDTNINNQINMQLTLPNVQNYTELVTSLQRDKKFERMIQDMTINQLRGKNSLAKFKQNY